MNQVNLGTGVVEAKWQELPSAAKNKILTGQRAFEERVREQGDDPNSRVMSDVWKMIGSDTKIAKVWDSLSEDQKKIIYGDFSRVPWSRAHLHGGHGYEQTFSPEKNGALLSYKHPPTAEKGLMNVVGVKAGILQTPTVAAEKYMRTGGGHILQRLIDEGKFRGSENLEDMQAPADVKADFINKHGAWHERAIENRKPIIGGISGHTLGYLNLYAEALSRAGQEERANAPTLETMRAIMLGGLIGNKRHHSYDEVMTASTSIKEVSGEKLKYTFPESYRDVFLSENRSIRTIAERAFEKTKDEYKLSDNTVLKEITKHPQDYYRLVGSDQRSKLDDYIDQLKGMARKNSTI
jgi:hypothetical protein